eukprot:IDg10841t1
MQSKVNNSQMRQNISSALPIPLLVMEKVFCKAATTYGRRTLAFTKRLEKMSAALHPKSLLEVQCCQIYENDGPPQCL